jgi:hypothetical protein
MSERILIVDADPEERAQWSRTLRSAGFIVDEANDARAAVAIAHYAPPRAIVYAGTRGKARAFEAICAAAEESCGRTPTVVVLERPRVLFRGSQREPMITPADLPAAIRRALAGRGNEETHLAMASP